MKIYTKTGDKGETSLFSGTRVSKNHKRLEAYGTIDELNSFVGLARSLLKKENMESLDPHLKPVQNVLFHLGSHLACDTEKLQSKLPSISNKYETLEKDIDKWCEETPPLKEFVLPTGTELASYFHLCRTICRRAERQVISVGETESIPDDIVIYLNRLSDWFFILARYVNHTTQTKEDPWDKSV